VGFLSKKILNSRGTINPLLASPIPKPWMGREIVSIKNKGIQFESNPLIPRIGDKEISQARAILRMLKGRW
jgi:hypothetical protein